MVFSHNRTFRCFYCFICLFTFLLLFEEFSDKCLDACVFFFFFFFSIPMKAQAPEKKDVFFF